MPAVSSDSDSDADGDITPKSKKAKKIETEQPMIITICTPLMSRVHQHIRQASELVFCDSTSSLDRFNASLFIFSTSYPTGGLPLAAMITSDEQENAIKQGLEMIKDVVPENAFYGCGSDQGPAVVMTDDCTAEEMPYKKSGQILGYYFTHSIFCKASGHGCITVRIKSTILTANF